MYFPPTDSVAFVSLWTDFALFVSDGIKSFWLVLLAFTILLTLNVCFNLQFDEQEDIEFRMPSRYSQSYDFDSTLDSPTVRSSTSTQPVDEDAVVADHGYEVKPTNLSPPPSPSAQKVHLAMSYDKVFEIINWNERLIHS